MPGNTYLQSLNSWRGPTPQFSAANINPAVLQTMAPQTHGFSPVNLPAPAQGNPGLSPENYIDMMAYGGSGYGAPAGSGGGGVGGFIKNLMSTALDKTDASGAVTQGWAMPVIQGATGMGELFMGMKNYGLAKDMFKQSKEEFNMNWDAQKQLTNAQMEDRQRARVAANPGGYQSVDTYMNTHGIR